jgi:hypothetical protein
VFIFSARVTPLQGEDGFGWSSFPGRCPGLRSCCAFGAQEQSKRESKGTQTKRQWDAPYRTIRLFHVESLFETLRKVVEDGSFAHEQRDPRGLNPSSRLGRIIPTESDHRQMPSSRVLAQPGNTG